MPDLEQFEQYWDNEVKALATKCAEGVELIHQLEKAATEAEKKAIIKKMESYGKRDWHAPWFISQMIFYVEHDLAGGRSPLIRIVPIRGTLNSEDYFRDVFKGQDCEEARNYRALGEKLNKAYEMLV